MGEIAHVLHPIPECRAQRPRAVSRRQQADHPVAAGVQDRGHRLSIRQSQDPLNATLRVSSMNGSAFKLGTFAKRGDPPFVGIVLGNDVIELSAAHAAYRASPHRGTLSETGSILALLENWDANFSVLQEIVAFLEKERPKLHACDLA